MQSIKYLNASDGTANASLMTVQTLRSPGATTILVNTVTGVHATGFHATMGAPHTFTDPVTGETITIISDATAVDFAGHINAGQIIIDAIAPGYVDTRGSLVGDIVIIRPISEWSNNVANVLAAGALNDNGTLAITAMDNFYKPGDITQTDFVRSGGMIAQTTLLTASFSDIVYYIAGLRYTKTGVANRIYTINKDTYVDIDNTGTLTYTEVANNATSPALVAGRIRLTIVVTSGTTITFVNQGQLDTSLAGFAPQVSGNWLTLTDSIGNTIHPNTPMPTLIGYRQITTNTANVSTVSPTVVAGLVLPVIIPAGRRAKVYSWASDINSNSASYTTLQILDAATSISRGQANIGGASVPQFNPTTIRYIDPLAVPTLKTYSAALASSAATVVFIEAAATFPAFIAVVLE